MGHILFLLYSEYWPHPLSYGSFFTIYSPPYREGPGVGPSFGEVWRGLLLGFHLLDFPAQGSHEAGHERTEQVEEAIRQVGKRGHSEHG